MTWNLHPKKRFFFFFIDLRNDYGDGLSTVDKQLALLLTLDSWLFEKEGMDGGLKKREWIFVMVNFYFILFYYSVKIFQTYRTCP